MNSMPGIYRLKTKYKFRFVNKNMNDLNNEIEKKRSNINKSDIKLLDNYSLNLATNVFENIDKLMKKILNLDRCLEKTLEMNKINENKIKRLNEIIYLKLEKIMMIIV